MTTTSGRISAVLLAAGGSRRLGRPKQLLLYRNDFLINYIIAQIKNGGLLNILVILGNQFEQIKSVITSNDVKIIYNPLWEQGVSTSIKAGIKNVDSNDSSVIFFVVDQPYLEPEIIKKIVKKSENSDKLIIAAEVEGNLVHPVLFRKELFPKLSILQGDVGGKALMRDRSIVDTVIWENRKLVEDIDSEEDYKSLIRSKNT